MYSHPRKWLPAIAGLATGQVQAAYADGDFAIDVALPLALLGVLAIVMGIRNLHELRYRRLVPGHRSRPRASGAREDDTPD